MKRFFLFDKWNTWFDWRLVLTSKDTTAPEPKTNYVELNGADGSIDLTEALTGEVAYGDRTVAASFSMSEGTHADREAMLRDISAALHGKRVKIVEPDDIFHYFVGRTRITAVERQPAYITFTIEATCDPWRYAANEIERTVTIEGAADVVVHNNGTKTLCPVVHVTGTVRITSGGVSTTLTDGAYRIADIRLRHGVNVIRTDGTGVVTFVYREADL